MIYIEDKDDKENILLPQKYYKLNNLCAIIYDQITELFIEDNYKSLTVTEFKNDSKRKIPVGTFQGDKNQMLEWLKSNNLNNELTAVLTKDIAMSIIGDFMNFIYESLSCAKRGKLTVAYALLRKPLTDELLILEQLLYDSQNFIQRYYHSGDPADYDPSHQNTDKRQIIINALSKIKTHVIFTEDIIYNLRYDKTCPSGINGISNHALHIVTRDKNYKTDNKNLNFVFSGRNDLEIYWKHYYYFVPYLLLYSVAIIDNLIFSYLPDRINQDVKVIKSFKQLIGILLFNESCEKGLNNGNNILFDALSQSFKLDCKKCKKEIKFSKSDFVNFFDSNILLCPKCSDNQITSTETVLQIKKIMDELS